MLPLWVKEAASLPLAFAQVREDPRLDIELCARLGPQAVVVMVASGGDTAVCLSRLRLGQLILVDVNPAQLALTRCKLHLAAQATPRQALEWLGHAPLDPSERRARVSSRLDGLGLPPETFGPLDLVAQKGPDFVGRYEMLFAALQNGLKLAPDTHQETFSEVFSLPNLVALFGTQATQNPRRDFASHFTERTRLAVARPESGSNPFLWQLLEGRFPEGEVWDWLTPKNWTALQTEPQFVHSPMREALEAMPPETVDWLHLSNILDWLPPEDATLLLQTSRRALKRGASLIVRQLNSSLDIPRLPCDLEWSELPSESDRSFFYPNLYVGRKS